jgi:hypothetical protein
VPVLQHIPTEQSYELEHLSPICEVPRQVPLWQLPDEQSVAELHDEPFGNPPLGPHVPEVLHFPDRHS